MLIKCPDCGHDNQLGAIFCRSCGSKLNIEQLRPTVKDMKYKVGAGVIVQKILGIVVFLAVVAIIGAILIPFGLTRYQPATEDIAKASKTKYDAMSASINKGYGTTKHTFSPAEATACYNSELIATAAGDAGVDHASFDILPSGDTVIRMESSLLGMLPVHFEVIGKPTSTGANFDVSSAKMGHLPIPIPFLKDKVVDKAGALTHGDSLKIVKALRGVEIVDGNFVISVEASKPEAAK